MATSWSIEVGYNSGDSCDIPRDEQWPTLKKIALDICEHPERIVEEARRFGAPEDCGDPECCTLDNHAERYKLRNDLTLEFIEAGERGNDDPYIHQMASGDRELKEHIRRAFCRLVIYEAHKLGLEVNLLVS